MRFVAVIALIMLASTVSARSYTGICLLDPILNALDWLASLVKPTTTTTTTTTTTSTSTTTTSTTTTTVPYTTTTTTTTLHTTTTTLPAVECVSVEDCPADTVTHTCNFDGDVVRVTRIFFCANPGGVDSECKSRETQRVMHCESWESCVDGTDHCVED